MRAVWSLDALNWIDAGAVLPSAWRLTAQAVGYSTRASAAWVG
eukprot:CAMPEP_0204570582 /NCGR_PEP_ID=MMETSP0661-20131031/38404_1 /ASSEMBLY_ACC=CAM_ASM_000606 /TAXON_ID=109239 /ORGANISM="Alexandrium margalefi, Strain AMGDE01CS-322" /LENGTH=42 /DNA_ID= /DNA_START= /DNA_END= /DNA_ORIENTATION=